MKKREKKACKKKAVGPPPNYDCRVTWENCEKPCKGEKKEGYQAKAM